MALIGEVSPDKFVLFLAVIILSLTAGSILSAYLRRHFNLRNKKSWFYVLLPKVLMYSIYFAGFYYATYKIIKFDVRAFAAAFGIIGLLVAFSSQHTLQNIIAGVILLFDRSVQERDYIEFNGMLCKVDEVSLRKTRLRTMDGRVIIVPNAQFVTASLTTYSKSSFYRLSIEVPIHPEADIEKAKSVLYQTAVENPDVVPKTQIKRKSLIQTMLDLPTNIQKFEPKVIVTGISKEKTSLELHCWITGIRARARITSELLIEIKKRFTQEGIRLG